VEILVMANRRTIARQIAAQTGLEPRLTEKIIRYYFAVIAANAGEAVGLGKLGRLVPHRRVIWRRETEEPSLGGGKSLIRMEAAIRQTVRFRPSKSLKRAAEEGTIPPEIRPLLDGS
jgi:nucleoid DNA-binding protein